MNRRLVLGLIAAALAVAACGSSGSSSTASGTASTAPLATPSGPDATAAATPGGSNEPAASEPATASPSSFAPSPAPTPAATPRFSLTTAAFGTEGVIPARFTCDGRDVSPAMAWTGTPAGTKWLVLLVDDIDAQAFVHWIAYAIAPGTSRLAEGAGAASSQLAQGRNDFGRVCWGGPCPPSGTHRYVFTLYALAAPLGLSGTPDGRAVRAALARAQVLGEASITAKYARGG